MSSKRKPNSGPSAEELASLTRKAHERKLRRQQTRDALRASPNPARVSAVRLAEAGHGIAYIIKMCGIEPATARALVTGE